MKKILYYIIAMKLIVKNNSDVNKFNNNFKSGCWLVFFFAPWCGHCNDFMPKWDEYVNKYAKYQKGLNVAAIQDDMIGKVRPQKEVNGFPTIKMFMKTKELDTFENQERTPENLKLFSESNLNKILNRLKSKKSKKSKKKRKSKKKKNKNVFKII